MDNRLGIEAMALRAFYLLLILAAIGGFIFGALVTSIYSDTCETVVSIPDGDNQVVNGRIERQP